MKNRIIIIIACMFLVALVIAQAYLDEKEDKDIFSSFDKLYDAIINNNAEEITNRIEKLGLNADDINYCHLNDLFFSNYLEENTKQDCFSKLTTIYEYGKDNNSINLDIGDTILEYFIEKNMIDADLHQLKYYNGYYKDNPDAVPQPKEYSVFGSFNNSNDGNSIYSDSRKNNVSYTYYGDFAVAETSGYSYNPGRYEWVNGVFYDEQPSWNYYSNEEYYFRGKKINEIKLYKFEGQSVIYYFDYNKLKGFEGYNIYKYDLEDK